MYTHVNEDIYLYYDFCNYTTEAQRHDEARALRLSLTRDSVVKKNNSYVNTHSNTIRRRQI